MIGSPGSIAGDLGARPQADLVARDARRQPRLELEPPDLPEALRDRCALFVGERAEPAARLARAGEHVVHERPVRLGELRRVVAVDDVDPRGALLRQQRRPLERALAAADDQHAPAAEPLEVDRTDGVRPLRRREPAHESGGSTAKWAMPGAATTRSAWIVEPSAIRAAKPPRSPR